MTVGLAVADLDLRGEGRLGPAEQRRQHLAGLVAVVVDRLLADDDQAGLFGFGHALDDLGDSERLDLIVGLDQDRPVGAHGERGAQRLFGLGRTDRDDDHFLGLAGFLQPQRLLDGDLVERVHRHLHIGKLDARAIRLHADLHVVVDNPLHGDENLHGVLPSTLFAAGKCALRRRSDCRLATSIRVFPPNTTLPCRRRQFASGNILTFTFTSILSSAPAPGISACMARAASAPVVTAVAGIGVVRSPRVGVTISRSNSGTPGGAARGSEARRR